MTILTTMKTCFVYWRWCLKLTKQRVCYKYTDIIMHADVLETLGARALWGIIIILFASLFRVLHQSGSYLISGCFCWSICIFNLVKFCQNRLHKDITFMINDPSSIEYLFFFSNYHNFEFLLIPCLSCKLKSIWQFQMMTRIKLTVGVSKYSLIW